MDYIKLNKTASYSEEKIKSSHFKPEDYVTTDSLLQDKMGRSISGTFPSSPVQLIKYKKNDILLGNIRPYLKKIWFSNSEGGCSSDVLVFNVNNKFDPKFIYYALLRDDFFLHVMKGSKGTKMPRGDKNHILDFHIPDFEISKQKKISSILSSIDQKIDINTQINLALESYIKLIYNYWFVQYDFPDDKGDPYKTSGGEMQWNEQLKKNIPLKWEVVELRDLFSVNSKKYMPNKDESKIDTLDLSVMPTNSVCISQKNDSSAFETNLFTLKKFDILFGAIRPYLLKAGFSPIDGLVTGTVHSLKIKDENFFNFGLCTISHESIFSFALDNSKGTKMPVIGIDDLLNYKVAISEDLINTFNNNFPIKEIIANNINENFKLIDLRGWLIPLLMNNQISII